MKLSNEFENLVLKQLESFGCSMGVKDLVVYLASAKEGSNAGFELIGQWPHVERSLMPIDDDPELKVSSPNRRWYPLQSKDILIGVLRVETDFKHGEWPILLDSRLKALSISLANSFSIEIKRQKNDEEISFLRSQVSVIIHQIRNPLAALRTYAKLLIKRLGSDSDALEIVESILTEQKQINQYVNTFEELSKPIKIPIGIGEERLLLPPNINNSSEVNIKELLEPIIERGKANATLQNKNWIQFSHWPHWTLEARSPRYGVVAEIIANLLENAFKYSKEDSEIGIALNKEGIAIFDNGKKISNKESEKIFQKGYRGMASKDTKGSGVGLYLAKKLAQQIGGELILVDDKFAKKIDLDFNDVKKRNIFYLKIPI